LKQKCSELLDPDHVKWASVPPKELVEKATPKGVLFRKKDEMPMFITKVNGWVGKVETGKGGELLNKLKMGQVGKAALKALRSQNYFEPQALDALKNPEYVAWTPVLNQVRGTN